jgi:hypothetical protein
MASNESTPGLDLESSISAVIAFASKTCNKPLYDEQRLLTEEAIPTGLPDLLSPDLSSISNTLSDKRRLIVVLDSLANLSISKPYGQVHAVGMRIFFDQKENKTRVHLIISGNDDVPKASINHLSYIWKTISELSALYAKQRDALPSCADSPEPPPPNRSKETIELERDFCLRSLKFSWAKVCRRIAKGLDKFKDMDLSKLDKNDPLRTVFSFLIHLEHYTNIQKRNIEWDKVQKMFYFMKVCIDENREKRSSSYLKVPANFRLDRYLLKIVAAQKDIGVLLALARSPRCRKILRGFFEIRALQEFDLKPTLMTSSIPQTGEQWRSLIDSVLEDRNKYKTSSDDMLELVGDTVNAHCSEMETYNLRVTNTVHCECKLVLYFQQQSSDQPRPYSYIGVSKLSCRGCDIFLDAVNKVFGSNFLTKGCHHKWYYPWRFPQLNCGGTEVAKEMYKGLCVKFSRTYHGFRVMREENLSDSDSESGGIYKAPDYPKDIHA